MIDREEILKKISGIANEYEQGAQINEETILVGPKSNLGLSSLDFISVIVGIEDFYKISIPEEEIQNRKLGNISNLVNYILEKRIRPS